MREKILSAVVQQDIPILLDLVRQPYAVISINAYDVGGKTILCHAFELRNKIDKNARDALAIADMIILALMEFGSDNILQIEQEAKESVKVLRLEKKVVAYYNVIFKSICKEPSTEKPDLYNYSANIPNLYYLFNKFVVLNQVDNPLQNIYTSIIMNSKRKKYSPMAAAPIFTSENFEWQGLIYWYMTCIYYRDHIIYKKFDKPSWLIFFEYMLLLKSGKDKSNYYKDFVKELDKNKEIIMKFSLMEIKYVANFITLPETGIHSSLLTVEKNKKSKRKRNKKVKQVKPIEKRVLVDKAFIRLLLEAVKGDSAAEKCKAIVRVAYIFKAITKENNLFANAFAEINQIFAYIPGEEEFVSQLTEKDLSLAWNSAIQNLLIETHQYFSAKSAPTALKKRARLFVDSILAYIDLDLSIRPEIENFKAKFLCGASKVFLFGSLATRILELSLGLSKDLKAFDINIQSNVVELQKAEGFYSNQRYQSFRGEFNGKTFDVLLRGDPQFDSKDSYKSFAINLISRKLVATRENIVLLIKRERKFDLTDISASLLAYYFREFSRNSLKLAPNYTVYLDDSNNLPLMKKAAGLFLTKYILNVKSNCFEYFNNHLYKYVFLASGVPNQELRNQVKSQVEKFLQNTKIVQNGINRFASIYLVVIKMIKSRLEVSALLDESAFPIGVVQFSNYLMQKSDSAETLNAAILNLGATIQLGNCKHPN